MYPFPPLKWSDRSEIPHNTRQFHYCVLCKLLKRLADYVISYDQMIVSEWYHDDVIKWKNFPLTCPVCGELTGHRWIPHTKASDAELWCFFCICPWINGWVNNCDAGDLKIHRARYDITLSHTPLCISMISGVCVQGMWNAQVKGQVTETHRLKVNSHCDTALFFSMYDITMVQP